jgi:hypothetical protein
MAFQYPPAGNKPSYNFDELTDITITDPQDGDIIRYDDATSQWVNVVPSATLENLSNVNNGAASNGQYLRYNGTAGEWEAVDFPSIALNDLSDVGGTPSNGDVLTYNTGSWAPSAPKDALNELNDVIISSVKLDQVLGYTGSAEWKNIDPRTFAPAIYPIGTNRYSFPLSTHTKFSTTYASTALAIKFGQEVTINKWAFAYTNNGTTASGNTGVEVRGFIYEAGNTGRPHTLIKDLGSFTVLSSDAVGGSADGVIEVNLGSSVNLSGNTQYFVGMAIYPVDADNHTESAGPSFVLDTQQAYNVFWNNGINPLNFGNGSSGFVPVGCYFVGAIQPWAGFDLINDALPDNIQNMIGIRDYGFRIGLNVSALL